MHFNTKLGLWLFAVYLAFYCGFVFINSFSPRTMELTPIAGVNLAILYGFGLIIFAFVLAMLYGVMCRPDEDETGMQSKKVDSSVNGQEADK